MNTRKYKQYGQIMKYDKVKLTEQSQDVAITILVGVLPNPLHEIDDILSLQLKNITPMTNFENEVKSSTLGR